MASVIEDPAVAAVSHHPEDTADEAVRAAYAQVAGPDGAVENLYLAMSHTPGAIGPLDRHYRYVLHGDDCPLERWLREYIAAFVAILCGAEYAVANHGENFQRFYGDRVRAARMLAGLRDGSWRRDTEDARLLAILVFAEQLSLRPAEVGADGVAALRAAGLDDVGISYVVQIAASFACWARVINGLGIALGAGPVGLADPDGDDQPAR